MCVPLIMIATCSTAMSYQWANNLVYRLSGSPIPAANSGPRLPDRAEQQLELEGSNSLCVAAEKKVAQWQSITIRMPGGKSPNVSFLIDAGEGGRPDRRYQLIWNDPSTRDSVFSFSSFLGAA